MGKDKAKKAQKRKAKLKKRLQVANRPAKPRACGPCFGCCVHFPVEGLPDYEGVKPAGEPCKHLTDNEEARCGSYTNRPPVCGAYKCLWLWDGGTKKQRTFYKEDRPDLSGVIFDLTDSDHPATVALRRPVMVARAIREGGLDTEKGQALIDKFLALGMVVALVRGHMEYEFRAANRHDAAVVAAVYSDLPKFKVLKKDE